MKYQKKDGTDNRDHFSNLPDDVISHILSRLPTNNAVQTCVLSKAWEYKWTSVYNIDISLEEDDKLMFVEFVDSVLFNTHNVRGFRFHSRVSFLEEELSHLKRWLFTVFRRNVEKVKIRTIYGQVNINLPRSLSTCISLRELEMDTPSTWKTPVNSYFPNLTRLYLSYVRIKNDSNSDTLAFHFPVLKTFEICLHKWLNVRFVEFYAPALISFISSYVYDGKEIDSYTIKIIGASLERFQSAGSFLEAFLLTGSTVSYAALEIDGVSVHHNMDGVLEKSSLRIRRLLKEFSSLKSLELTCYLAQALAGSKSGHPLPTFAKLERLALSYGDEYGSGGTFEQIFEGLFEVLRSGPVLKHLTIEGLYELDIDQEDFDADMMEPVPSCVVSHLEEINIKCYSGEHVCELQLTKYLLEKGARLRNFFLGCDSFYKDDIRMQLSKLPRASASLEFLLQRKTHTPLWESSEL